MSVPLPDESAQDVSSAVRMRRVTIESPFRAWAGVSEISHTDYLRRALSDAFDRGEAPFASHMFYTPLLDDADPNQRALGMAAGHAWASMSDVHAFYLDMGFSAGMFEGFRTNVTRHYVERSKPTAFYSPESGSQEIVLRSLRTKLEIVVPREKVYLVTPGEACEYFEAQALAFVDLVKRLS